MLSSHATIQLLPAELENNSSEKVLMVIFNLISNGPEFYIFLLKGDHNCSLNLTLFFSSHHLTLSVSFSKPRLFTQPFMVWSLPGSVPFVCLDFLLCISAQLLCSASFSVSHPHLCSAFVLGSLSHLSHHVTQCSVRS